ncbi:MAG: J domain-containing protein [Alphaproteobacteria bacterium]|nr:J domain-containing protein [Alphaproteobacteria bacterium]
MAFDPRETIRETVSQRACDHEGCSAEGAHRAPKSRSEPGQFHWFCLDHVREYNKSWNYFEGMSDAEVEDYRHNTNTWHRPTWGVTGKSQRTGHKYAIFEGIDDQYGLFRDNPLGIDGLAPRRAKRRVTGPVEKALRRLGLSGEATPQEVKFRYKELAKRFHPDLNGGNKEAEERLKRINEAYSYLLSAKHV